MVKIGVDTGGTFTDIVMYAGGRFSVYKLMSTPENPAHAIIEGINHICPDEASRKTVVHGTTVATNALLERKGAKTALVTTRGFEDIIDIGRQNRDKLYDLFWTKPQRIVAPELKIGIKERIDSRGRSIEPMEVDEAELFKQLESLGARSVAVCLLNSYVNSSNEEYLAKIIRENIELPVTTSSELIPEYREYERTATTVVNAYLVPVVRSYMNSLEKEMSGADFYVIQSNGGITDTSQAALQPVKIITSGPAGGVVGAWNIASNSDISRIITYDMGGTSTDISLVENTPVFSSESIIDGIPLKVPMINVTTIGAGGGSLAYIDKGGVLKVGPESAGADPGPACYGKGILPTVTDANVVLGRIDPLWFLGGKMSIYPERSFRALELLTRDGNISPEEMAQSVINIANSNMERALRVVSVERGYNPREFFLFSFGGAGGLHACELARALEMKGVIFPFNPGVLSALGMVLADFFKDYSMNCLTDNLEEQFGKAEKSFELLTQMAMNDFPQEDLLIEKSLDMRYKGQSYELTVGYSGKCIEEFHKIHRRRYGYEKLQSDVEFVNVRIRAKKRNTDTIELPDLKKKKQKVPSQTREIISNGTRVETTVYRRDDFYAGFNFDGPALVLEDTSTLYIPAGFSCSIDQYGSVKALF